MSNDARVVRGSRNTYYGKVDRFFEGDDNVVIGSTDERGNTVIPGGTAAGSGAKADSTSAAIGYRAGAGQSKGSPKKD